MKLKHLKTTLAGAWLLTVCAVVIVGDPTTVAGWMLLAAVGVLPPLALMQLWNEPAQTMSESISQARR
jgi:hypothetical protein